MSQPAGPAQQRDQRLPEAGIEFEEVAECIADEFPQADQAALRALAADRAVLPAEIGATVQAVRRPAAQVLAEIFAQDPGRDRHPVAEAGFDLVVDIAAGAFEKMIQRLVVGENV